MNYIATAAADPATGAVADICARAEKRGAALVPQPSDSLTRPLPTNAVIETILSRSAAKYYDPTATLYDDQPQRQRDEAVRSATFGAAAIIYAARSQGLGSTPMIGFDAEAVHREFGLAEDEVPVMLLTVGPERAGNWPQKPRMPVADVLGFA